MYKISGIKKYWYQKMATTNANVEVKLNKSDSNIGMQFDQDQLMQITQLINNLNNQQTTVNPLNSINQQQQQHQQQQHQQQQHQQQQPQITLDTTSNNNEINFQFQNLIDQESATFNNNTNQITFNQFEAQGKHFVIFHIQLDLFVTNISF